MINHIYQLMAPKAIAVKFDDSDPAGKVIVRPDYMSVCHADQRYYLGSRAPEVLKKKLPMALIHECCGTVIDDCTGTFMQGEKVVLIPNQPTSQSDVIFENYRKGSYFLASGYDGFMRELVYLEPDRIVSSGSISPVIASITEFVSVCCHAVVRLMRTAHSIRSNIAIWGDGSLSYCLSVMLKELMPESSVTVIGLNEQKLSMFSHADERLLSNNIPNGFECDHAFECAGGEGSGFAVDDIIKYIRPQGSAMLMGVSENKIPVNTRDILEKGLTFAGCSRSGREDFETAVRVMSNPQVQNRLERIITKTSDVRSIDDIHRVFTEDRSAPFKTVFGWKL